ncbi:DEAD/DEAH box helicase [Geomonas sp. Red32]|uniref:DEAD/DEAH box helicase n=1 Tax=Geomonas sp. Red32 TaxID=2912856 RepID=UPI00202CCA62|nr:DEAD/DEAH box helicase [Geomonas sp. Red32]MCM0084535.1 DEAD/DEAH box helicase [Geomonas sp. Red32]
MPFSSLGLTAELQQAITEQKFKRPYPIQKRVIPAILQGRDLLAIAKSGSGKTAGFTLPLLQLAQSPQPGKRGTLKSLILVPTRELAVQIGEVARQFGRHLSPRVKTAAVFGGVAINPQMVELNGTELLVATPGRLLDLVAKNSVRLSMVTTLVLDEADKLLEKGFQDELERILALLPKNRQNLMFSATFGEDVRQLASGLLHDPLEVAIKEEASEPDLIAQQVYLVDASRKGPLLRYLIKSGDWQQVLVFTASQRRADIVVKKLIANGITAATFHGGMSQGGRTTALDAFKAGTLRVLVATDLAARGIDIKFLPHVVNLELPRSPADYIHRIGRTGRAEAAGIAVSLLCPEDLPHFKVIEKLQGKRLPKIDTAELDLAGY